MARRPARRLPFGITLRPSVASRAGRVPAGAALANHESGRFEHA